jgi:hypothetical protein
MRSPACTESSQLLQASVASLLARRTLKWLLISELFVCRGTRPGFNSNSTPWWTWLGLSPYVEGVTEQSYGCVCKEQDSANVCLMLHNVCSLPNIKLGQSNEGRLCGGNYTAFLYVCAPPVSARACVRACVRMKHRVPVLGIASLVG